MAEVPNTTASPAEATPTYPPNTLRAPVTHTTTHDPTTLASTFASSRPAHFCSPAGPSMRFSTSHVAAMPPNFTDDADLAAFSHTDETIGLVKAGATIMRYVDFAPGTTTAMHRTQSLDFGICLEGTVVAVMDGGEERRLGRGDVVVQRGTMHAWRNAGEGWARMAYVMTASDPVVVGGRELEAEMVDGEEKGQTGISLETK